MRTKISKVAKDLNVGVGTVVDFLRKHNIEVENNPNARVDDSAVSLLMSEFSSDKADKIKVDGNIQKRKDAKKEKTDRRPEPASGSTAAPGLKVLGKIDLDAARKGGARAASSPAPSSSERKPQPEAVKPRETVEKTEKAPLREEKKEVKVEAIPHPKEEVKPTPEKKKADVAPKEAAPEAKPAAPEAKPEAQNADDENTSGNVFRLS
ncbi:MAG: hypothetical protein K2M10_02980, partial [Muribaculaceae bacterium]|nr:hypothetical protein [Muribaculaceae bacterium]